MRYFTNGGLRDQGVLAILSLMLLVAVFQADSSTVTRLWLPVAAVGVWALQLRMPRVSTRPDAWVNILLALLLTYAVLQTFPAALLPPNPFAAGVPAVIREHGEMIRQSLRTVVSQLLRLAAYALVFTVIRRAAAGMNRSPWRLVYPILAAAGLEAVLGILQFLLSHGNVFATGTYWHHSYFGNFLALSLPFGVLYLVLTLRRFSYDQPLGLRFALAVCGALFVPSIMLVAILVSASRSAFAAVVAAILTMIILTMARSRPRSRTAAVLALVLVLAAALTLGSTARMGGRFERISSAEGFAADAPVVRWQQAWRIVSAFPLFGTGMGTYATATRIVTPGLPQQDSAHSDYLELLVELGGTGFAILSALFLTALALVLRSAVTFSDKRRRYFVITCAAAMIAAMIHSVVESNMSVPPNAILLAWIAGMGTGLKDGSQPPDSWSNIREVKSSFPSGFRSSRVYV